MLIHEQYRKCTAFLFVDKLDEGSGRTNRIPAATVFFVAVPTGKAAVPDFYAVTARHVVDSARPYGLMYVRVNKIDGGYHDFDISPDDWIGHSSTDVAVTQFVFQPGLDLKFLPLEMLATDEYIAQHKIIEGDKVFFIGLFSEHAGLERSQPIVRFGNISLMPREPLPLRLQPESDHTTSVDAYLVEARSWGGHSGAPAFVYYADTDRQPVLVTQKSEPPALLGLVHGHYEIKQDVAFLGDILGSGKVPVNAGMAAVIPAQKVIDVLMTEELVEERKRRAKDQTKQGMNAPTPDTGIPPEPFTREDFGDALRKVSRRIKPSEPDEASSET
jgi:hypothetical protein